MSHDSFLTTRDRAETSVQPSKGGLFVSWGAATLGLAIASIALGGLAATTGIALAIGAAFTGFKTVEGFFDNKHTWKKAKSVGSISDFLDRAQNPQPGLANHLNLIPELTDDVNNARWRRQVAEQAFKDANRNSHKGY